MAFKVMNLRRDDHCAVCVAPTRATQRAWWDSIRKEVTCTRCRPVTYDAWVVASQPGGLQLDSINAIATQLSSGLPNVTLC